MIRPLGNRVLVRPDAEQDTSPGGIVLPDSAQEKPQKGTVVAVGEGSRDDSGKLVPMEVKKGDRVIYSKYGGTEVRDGTDEYVILREDDIYAIEVVARKPRKSAKKPAREKSATRKKARKRARKECVSVPLSARQT